MSAFNRYTKEEWSEFLQSVLPIVFPGKMVEESMKNQPYGMRVGIKVYILASITEETYEQGRKIYEDIHKVFPFRFTELNGDPRKSAISKEGLERDYPLDSGLYTQTIDAHTIIPFVLEMPFGDLPLYINSDNDVVVKAVKARLGLGH